MYQLLFTLCSAWHHLFSVLTIEALSSPGSINKTKILPGTSKLMLFSIILFKQSSVCSEESCNSKKVTGYSIILIPIQDVIVYITDYRIISFWPWSLINLLVTVSQSRELFLNLTVWKLPEGNFQPKFLCGFQRKSLLKAAHSISSPDYSLLSPPLTWEASKLLHYVGCG